MPPEGLCHTSGRGQACLLGAPSWCVERVGAQLFCFSLSCTGENSVSLTFIKEAPCMEAFPREKKSLHV